MLQQLCGLACHFIVLCISHFYFIPNSLDVDGPGPHWRWAWAQPENLKQSCMLNEKIYMYFLIIILISSACNYFIAERVYYLWLRNMYEYAYAYGSIITVYIYIYGLISQFLFQLIGFWDIQLTVHDTSSSPSIFQIDN